MGWCRQHHVDLLSQPRKSPPYRSLPSRSLGKNKGEAERIAEMIFFYSGTSCGKVPSNPENVLRGGSVMLSYYLVIKGTWEQGKRFQKHIKTRRGTIK